MMLDKYLKTEYFIIFFGVFVSLLVAIILSPTVDEGKHVLNGLSYLSTGECCLHEESPSSALHAIFLSSSEMDGVAVNKGMDFEETKKIYYDDDWKRTTILSRLPTVFFFGILLVFFWVWAKEVLPRKSALLSLLMISFSPSLLGHTNVATADIFLTTLAFVCFFMFWRYTKENSNKNLLLLCASTGVLLITKISSIFIYSSLFIIALVYFLNNRKTVSLNECLKFFSMMIILPLIILNFFYFFDGTLSSAQNYEFRSGEFKWIQNSILGIVPIPLPEGFVVGMDWSRNDIEVRRASLIPSYIFGKKYEEAPLFYFPLAFVLKTSLIALFLFFLGCKSLYKKNEWLFTVLMFFITFFMVVNISFNKFGIGIRYILPLYPFFFLVIGFAFDKEKKLLKYLAIIFVIISLLNFPNFVSYYNVSGYVFEKDFLLIDSNLDWGQHTYLVEKDLIENPTKNVCILWLSPFYPEHLSGFESKVGWMNWLDPPETCTFYASVTHIKAWAEDKYPKLGKPDKILGGTVYVYYNFKGWDVFTE